MVDLEPSQGAEGNKTRPFIVISNDAANIAANRKQRGRDNGRSHHLERQQGLPVSRGLDRESKAQIEPALGEQVSTPDGDGRVVGHPVPKDSVVVRLNADGSRTVCPKASVCSSRKAYEQQHLPREP